MSNTGTTKVLLHVLNALYLIIALAICACSLWFFVQVYEFTSLRNSNHYLLDYNVYWPQAVPWIFFIVSVLAICVASFGFSATKKKNSSLLLLFVALQCIAVVALIAAAIICLVFADSGTTDNFIKDTIWDVYFQSKTVQDVEDSFNTIEKKLHCCGADSPRDYKNWKNEFPPSCCDVYFHGWFRDDYVLNCDFTNKLANERHGCTAVASQYARIVMKVLSSASILTAFLGIIAIVAAVSLSKNLKKRRIAVPPYETESKKVLL